MHQVHQEKPLGEGRPRSIHISIKMGLNRPKVGFDEVVEASKGISKWSQKMCKAPNVKMWSSRNCWVHSLPVQVGTNFPRISKMSTNPPIKQNRTDHHVLHFIQATPFKCAKGAKDTLHCKANHPRQCHVISMWVSRSNIHHQSI